MAKPSSFCVTPSGCARSFFAAAPEDLKRNQFGVALGGPMWRERIWFYGTYEGTRELSLQRRGLQSHSEYV